MMAWFIGIIAGGLAAWWYSNRWYRNFLDGKDSRGQQRY